MRDLVLACVCLTSVRDRVIACVRLTSVRYRVDACVRLTSVRDRVDACICLISVRDRVDVCVCLTSVRDRVDACVCLTSEETPAVSVHTSYFGYITETVCTCRSNDTSTLLFVMLFISLCDFPVKQTDSKTSPSLCQ